MLVSKLTGDMHEVLAEHLGAEYATAKLTLRTGRVLTLIAVDGFSEERISAADLNADPLAFDPAEVCAIEMLTLDTAMLAPPEFEDLGLVLDANDVPPTKPDSAAAGSQAAK